MNELFTIGDAVTRVGSTAFLVGVLVVLSVPSLKKKVFGNGVSKEFETLKNNHLHEISETLKRIETKLDETHDNTIFIKAKINGK